MDEIEKLMNTNLHISDEEDYEVCLSISWVLASKQATSIGVVGTLLINKPYNKCAFHTVMEEL